jgi:(2Fe-2S) ferredoxin
MSRYQRHLFVCTNERPAGHPRGCCRTKNSERVRDLFKEEVKRLGIGSRVRAQQSGCLDACEYGVTVVIYPEGIWYGGVTPDDVREIVERTLVLGEVIERLLVKHPRYFPGAMQYPRLGPAPGDEDAI